MWIIQHLKVSLLFLQLCLPCVSAMNADGWIVLASFLPVVIFVMLIFIYKSWKEVCGEEENEISDILEGLGDPLNDIRGHSPTSPDAPPRHRGRVVFTRARKPGLALDETLQLPSIDMNNNSSVTPPIDDGTSLTQEKSDLLLQVQKLSTEICNGSSPETGSPSKCTTIAPCSMTDEISKNKLDIFTITSESQEMTLNGQQKDGQQKKSRVYLKSWDSSKDNESPRPASWCGGHLTKTVDRKIKRNIRTSSKVSQIRHFYTGPQRTVAYDYWSDRQCRQHYQLLQFQSQIWTSFINSIGHGDQSVSHAQTAKKSEFSESESALDSVLTPKRHRRPRCKTYPYKSSDKCSEITTKARENQTRSMAFLESECAEHRSTRPRVRKHYFRATTKKNESNKV